MITFFIPHPPLLPHGMQTQEGLLPQSSQNDGWVAQTDEKVSSKTFWSLVLVLHEESLTP